MREILENLEARICEIDKTLAWILSSVVYIHDADGDRKGDVLGERRS